MVRFTIILTIENETVFTKRINYNINVAMGFKYVEK